MKSRRSNKDHVPKIIKKRKHPKLTFRVQVNDKSKFLNERELITFLKIFKKCLTFWASNVFKVI